MREDIYDDFTPIVSYARSDRADILAALAKSYLVDFRSLDRVFDGTVETCAGPEGDGLHVSPCAAGEGHCPDIHAIASRDDGDRVEVRVTASHRSGVRAVFVYLGEWVVEPDPASGAAVRRPRMRRSADGGLLARSVAVSAAGEGEVTAAAAFPRDDLLARDNCWIVRIVANGGARRWAHTGAF